MDTGSQHTPVRSELPHIKELFQTRHYIQCISTCQRLLSRFNDRILPVHPIHLAYLHFYIALSHDAIAREATIRSRQGELALAEKHYLAATAAVSPFESRDLGSADQMNSPTSSEGDRDSHRRASDAASIDSERSASTDATSVADDDGEQKPKISRVNRIVRFSPVTETVGETVTMCKPQRRRPSPIVISKLQRVPVAAEENLSAGIAIFTSMLNTHLASVRELRRVSQPPAIMLSSCRPRSSTNSFRFSSGESSYESRAMDQIRLQRKGITFRPRFDPTSVQQLCKDALSDL